MRRLEQTLRLTCFWAIVQVELIQVELIQVELIQVELIMENNDQKPKLNEGPSKSDKEKIEDQKKQNARLAERKGQRPAFPFKRRGF